jgi:hypothetical protein
MSAGKWHGGKGDKDRTADTNKFRNNYDLIDWSKGKEPKEPVKTETKLSTKTEEA